MNPDRFPIVLERYRNGDRSVKNELEAYFVYMAENHHVGDPKLDTVSVEEIVRDLYDEIEKTESNGFYYFLSVADVSVLYHLCIKSGKNRKRLTTKFFNL